MSRPRAAWLMAALVMLLLLLLAANHTAAAWPPQLAAAPPARLGDDSGNGTQPSPAPNGTDPSPSPVPPSPKPSPAPGNGTGSNGTSPSPSPPAPEPSPEPSPEPAPSPSPEPSPAPAPPPPAPEPGHEWRTLKHEPGYCAMYGVCGHRKDRDGLNCPINSQAVPPSDNLATKLKATCPSLWSAQGGASGRYCCTPDQLDQLATNVQKVAPFTVGCPACHHNFIQLWCVLTCSPDQATFTNVSAVQVAPDTNATVIAEVDVWLDPSFTNGLFDSCKDVKYGAANLPAMNFMGGGAATGQAWLDFLGLVKDKRVPPVGSPFQLNFNRGHPPPAADSTATAAALPADGDGDDDDDEEDGSGVQEEGGQGEEPYPPPGITPAKEALPGCGDPLLQCSCADCPPAPGCKAPPAGPPPDAGGCRVGAITCWDLTLLLSYLALVAVTAAAVITRRRRLQAAQMEAALGLEAEEPLLGRLGTPAGGPAAAYLYDGGDDDDGGAADESEPLPGDEHYPWLERRLQRLYTRLGVFVASRPLHVLLVAALVVGCCLLGLVRFKLETDPQALWVGPGSRAARDKASYEASFGPFYRVTQLILSTTPHSLSNYSAAGSGLPSIVTDANIRLLFDMQYMVDSLTEHYTAPGQPGEQQQRNASLPDVCFKPFVGGACATQSLLQYWQMNRTLYETEQAKSKYSTKLSPDYCFGHWATQCRSAFEAPMDPHVVLGGFEVGEGFRNYSADATAFVVTYPIDSDPSKRPAALAWEAGFIQLAQGELSRMAAAANLTLSFQTERSVEDELKRESYTDASVVATSYLVMLGYIALALAALPPPSQLLHAFVLSRAGLGAGGVLIVAASVAGALGLCSLAGLWATLIVMEVIPFLVLAVGVDNMFVLAHALGRQDPSLPLVTRAGLALGSAGPSITLAAACEVAAFGLGALTSMPAVRNFSICAALAVALDFGLQVTAFMALLVLDERRLAQSRLDCLPCLRVPYRDASGAWVYEDVNSDDYEPLFGGPAGAAGGAGGATGTAAGEPYFPPQQELPPVGGGPTAAAAAAAAAPGTSSGAAAAAGGVLPGVTKRGPGLLHGQRISLQTLLQAYMERVHAPLLMQPLVQAVVVGVFITGLFAAGVLIPRLPVGLDQAVALPRDSYLQDYYRDLYAYLRVGPPLYLVTTRVNVSDESPDVNKLCSVAGCRPDSLAVRIAQAALAPATTFIATPAASWVDDFLSWTNPALPKCCRLSGEPGPQLGPAGSRCPPPDQPPCSTNASACATCGACFTELPPSGRLNASDVAKYLPWFLEAVPSEGCAKGGAGAYNNALQKDPADPTGIAGLSSGVIAASAFRTYHSPLNSQGDFIHALGAARAFAETASKELGVEVYPYSIFHVFFEQYLNTRHDAAILLGLPLAAIFAITWAFTGSLWGSLILLAMLLSMMAQLGGAMRLAGIEVNAVSLVNLAMALGISVEFCAHILHSFCVSHGSRVARAKAALIKMGAPVTSGITLTKFAGVVVLAFARTQIFEVYYFRLYLALVILGFAHGLLLLPVVLSRVGPPSWSDAALAAGAGGPGSGNARGGGGAAGTETTASVGGLAGFVAALQAAATDVLGTPFRRGARDTELERARGSGSGGLPVPASGSGGGGGGGGGGGFVPPVLPALLPAVAAAAAPPAAAPQHPEAPPAAEEHTQAAEPVAASDAAASTGGDSSDGAGSS